jgi:hypothetical protein
MMGDGETGFGYHDLERVALGFALEDEYWAPFMAWCAENGFSARFRAWVEAGPDLHQLRREYLRHSPEPAIRALAD